MQSLKLLVTGCNGSIGRILFCPLAEQFEVYGLDMTGEFGERVYQADLSDYDELTRIIRQIGQLDCIVHLAGDHRVEAEWDVVLKNNIIVTHNIYQCAQEYGVKRIIFASSNHVTGMYEGLPPSLHTVENPAMVSIGDVIRPDGDYAVSKVFGEAVARQYYELYGIESICLRIGSVLEDDNPTHDPRFMKTWLSHRDLVQLVKKSIQANVAFGIYYGVSDNKGRFWDISNAKREIDFRPEDDASHRLDPR